jgi:hypothetical protein
MRLPSGGLLVMPCCCPVPRSSVKRHVVDWPAIRFRGSRYRFFSIRICAARWVALYAAFVPICLSRFAGRKGGIADACRVAR